MKIGTCVNFSEIDGMEKKFAQLREHNFDSCQLVSWNPAAWTDENASILKTLSDVTFIMNTDATMRQIYSKVST